MACSTTAANSRVTPWPSAKCQTISPASPGTAPISQAARLPTSRTITAKAGTQIAAVRAPTARAALPSLASPTTYLK